MGGCCGACGFLIATFFLPTPRCPDMREKKGPVERGYRPLDPPELDVDLLSFVLPPAMDIDAGYQFERPPIAGWPRAWTGCFGGL